MYTRNYWSVSSVVCIELHYLQTSNFWHKASSHTSDVVIGQISDDFGYVFVCDVVPGDEEK